MNSQQRPVALRLAKWHQAMANEPNRNGAKKEKHAITADLLRELLAEPVQEPVAWMSVYPGLPLFVTHAAHEHPQSIVVRESYTIPLYAAPQQQAEPVQEPKPTTASQFESVKEAKRAAEYELRYYRKMMNEKNAAEPQGEPVAWHVCSVNSDGSLSLEFAAPWEELAHEHINDAINEYDIDGAASWVVRPVYASPQPQRTEPPQDMPQQRKPLLRGEIIGLWKDRSDGPSNAEIISFARAIERAHGITGEQK